MNFEQKIVEEIKTAMKAGAKTRLDVLRSLRATILEFTKSGTGKNLDEAQAIKILNTAAKKRRDAIEMYVKANRSELADKEKEELSVIQEFLPEQMSEDAVRAKVAAIAEKMGASSMQDMGKVMGASMKELQGMTDGGTVQKIVKEILSS